MKKIKYIIITIIAFTLSAINTYAASASLSVNSSSIENGKSVTATVSVKSAAAWNITVSSAGSTSGCNEKFVGDSGTGKNTNRNFSVTCKATAQGIINFLISGDITDESGTNVKVSGSRNVTVTAPRPKSTDNKLNSLSVSGYEISPSFSKDNNEYTVDVPSTVEKITINATKANTYASVSGAGERDVAMGPNTFEIVVTSESGVSNIYKLTVNVEDLNPIEVTINKIKYTVVKELKNLIKPDLFEESTVIINEVEIPAFKNDIINYTLVGLKDSERKIELYIYNDNEYTKYNEFISNRISVVFLQLDKIPDKFKKDQIKINDELVTVYKNNDLTLIYGLNILTGKKNYYKYESEEKTIQIFDLEKYENEGIDTNNSKYISYALGLTTTILLIVCILQSINKKKYQKIINSINEQKNTKNNKK